MNDSAKGVLLVVVAGVLWGTLGTFVRFAGDVDAMVIAFYRCLFATIAGIFIVLLLRKLPELRPKRSRKHLFLLGMFNAVLIIAIILSIQLSTVANALLLFYTAPVIATFMSRIILKEGVKRESYISLAMSMIGIILIMGNGFETNMWIGSIFGLIAGLAYASAMVTGRYLKGYSGSISNFWQNAIATVLLVFFINPFSVPISVLPLLALMGLTLSAVAPLLFLEALRRIKTQDASIIVMLDPFTNIILAALIFSEIPDLLTSVGGALILSAVLLQIIFKRKSL